MVLLTICKKNRKIISATETLETDSKVLMSLNKETATQRAVKDLANRLGIKEKAVETSSVEDKEFRDMSLGATVGDEMAAQMISYGWSINLSANDKEYEYRGDKYQLRLVDFDGSNHMIESY